MISGLGRYPGEGNGSPLNYFYLENPHGQRSLAGYSQWGHKESDTAKQLSTARSVCSYRKFPLEKKKIPEEIFSQFSSVAQLCLTLCNPFEYSLPDSSVHGHSPGKNTGVGCMPSSRGSSQHNSGLPHCRQILCHLNHQGSPRILEWVAYSFSRGPS